MNDTHVSVPVRIMAALVLAFLALPIVLIFPIALNPSPYLSFPPKGLSLRWIASVAGDRDWLSSLWLSFRIALGSTSLSLLVSTLTALALVRRKFPLKRVVYALVLLPMIVPNVIAAIAMFFFFAAVDVFGNTLSIILGHAVVSLPVAVIILASTLQGVDHSLEQAAMSLGASNFATFRRITLPLIAPGVASASIFAFLTSFDELLIALFMSGPTSQTLPVRIWNAALFQLDPKIAAVSASLVVISVTALAAANLARRRV